jgi:hypothetical protein
MLQAECVMMMALFNFVCFNAGHGSPCIESGEQSTFSGSGYLISERIMERMSMIENAIRKIRSHFVLLGSLGLVCLFF